jgi:anaerobic dimethyl sulfoxide reductase subunit A
MKGVAAISQGAWYRPDSDANDTGGSINVLTSLKGTPLAKGNAQHTNLVQVELLKELSKMPHVQRSG